MIMFKSCNEGRGETVLKYCISMVDPFDECGTVMYDYIMKTYIHKPT